ncbi:S41 family peptidase [Riemerella columbina]|uniref:S41 family peptidase n=1 Tax=Riemerella columbina TaxID=103810 RepID=UPI00035C61D0|nr:S41 family peptidase [Riemerella columbina]
MINKIYISITLLVASLFSAQSPLWLRHSQISPDGKSIVFSYKGDIYKVSTNGGQAIRLTTHPAFDSEPIWSPDSQRIAFMSDREGGYQRLFIMSANGGTAKQLTFHSQKANPLAFTPDGNNIVYAANLQNDYQNVRFPKYEQVYQIPIDGGQPKRLLDWPTQALSFSDDVIYFEDLKGGENKWRKHHRSSVTRDIWTYQPKSQSYKRIIDWKGEDRNPVVSKDGQTLYFLSERDGQFNIYKSNISQSNQVQQLTFHKDFPVRFLSVSDNGLISYGYAGELYTLKEGESPKKLNISITTDVPEHQSEYKTFTSGATSSAVSPDGKQVAFVVRGEVFVTATDYNTTKQITETPAAEAGVTFGADGRILVYASYREGYWDLYKAEIQRSEDANFPNATLVKEEKLIPNDTSEKMYPQFSPDGKEIAFVQDRNRLAVYNLQDKTIRKITDDRYQVERNGDITFQWSPDSKWFVVEYVARHHAPYYDIGIIKADGTQPVFNLTDSGYFDTNPRWALGGDAIIWSSERYGMRNHASWGSMRDEMMVFLNKEAYDEYKMNKEEYELFKKDNPNEEPKDKEDGDKTAKNKKKEDKKSKIKPIKIDFENIQERIVRLTPNASNLGDAIITEDGKKLYYLASFESGYDLWEHDLRDKSTKLLSKLNGRSMHFDTDKSGKEIFLLGSSQMKKLDKDKKVKDIKYKASMKLDLPKERAFMFDMVKREEQERFYVKDMHGVDWEQLTTQYQKFLPYINNNYDFSEMLSELLGELNVSHTGSGYRTSGNAFQSTAELGLLYTAVDNGLKIDEVLINGPFDNARSKVKAGDIIEKIDGKSITLDQDFYAYLQGKIGQKILVSLYSPKNGKRWDEEIKGISSSDWNELLYQRWIKQRAADVERWSNGQLGYVHIRSMGDGSFREVYSDALGKYNDKLGMVIDIRNNGGGRLHEDVEVFFSGKKYLTQMIRGQRYADMPSRRWNKPSIMVVNEADYSNAHGTPWVYQHTKIGKLVGAPVPGTMTSVNWVTLQDPSLYFGIPVVGYQKADGSYLENFELQPDVLVTLDPKSATHGEDNQLKKAVEELLKQIKPKL